LAKAAQVSHRAYCYLRIFAEHASDEVAERYFSDPRYATFFKVTLDSE
jgi:hypothetical protein